MGERHSVILSTGSLREAGGVSLPRPGPADAVPDDVVARTEPDDSPTTDALQLAVAAVVLAGICRLVRERGFEVYGALVRAEGASDEPDRPAGVDYSVALDSALLPETATELLRRVDPAAALDEVPDGVVMRRVGHD